MRQSVGLEGGAGVAPPSGSLGAVRRSGGLVLVVWGIAVLLAATQAWVHRHRFNPDGISYLDLSDAWREGRPDQAVNGHWSPAYPALIALARIFAPGVKDELPVVHALNVLLFAAALGALHVLLRALGETRVARLGVPPAGWAPIPSRLFVPAGLLIGAYVLLRTTSLGLVTPDLLLVTPVLLATAAVVRIVSAPERAGPYLLLGAALGFGCLTKSFLFPLSVVTFATVAFAVGLRGVRARRLALALVVFAVVVGPQVASLSKARGRFTLSDSTWLSVLWLQKDVPYVHWRGGPDGAGAPDRPPRLVCEDPAVLEFATPVEGTYSLWKDPAHWHLGGNGRPALRGVVEALRRSGGQLLSLLRSFLAVLGPLVLLFVLQASHGRLRSSARKQWLLWLLPVAAAALYAPFHVEDRFMGGFLTLLAVALLDGTTLPEAALGRRGVVAVVGVLLLLTAALLAERMASESGRAQSPEHFVVRNALEGVGLVDRRESVAVVGDGLRAYWARFCGLRVVADVEVPRDGSTTWATDPQRLDCVRAGLRPAGVRYVFAPLQDEEEPSAPWRRLPGTSMALLDLR